MLPFNGIEHHVELTPYHEFISPDMVIETRGAGLRTNLNEAVRFKRVPELQCHYRGFVRGHHGSKAALSLCDGVVSMLPFHSAYGLRRFASYSVTVHRGPIRTEGEGFPRLEYIR